MSLVAPFPWNGTKKRVVGAVWSRFGNVDHYLEPFAGSIAVLLGRPHIPRRETICDTDGYITNFWRSMKYRPNDIIDNLDWPVNEIDLHAWHKQLIEQGPTLKTKLIDDPLYCDPIIAGRWCWGLCMWIGGQWCSEHYFKDNCNISQQRPELVSEKGVHATGIKGVLSKQRPHLVRGVGVHTSITLSGVQSVGEFNNIMKNSMEEKHRFLTDWFSALECRLRNVRITQGDWKRIVTPTVLDVVGRRTTGVFLDPPYSLRSGRCKKLYSSDDHNAADECFIWARENENIPNLKIAVCGLEGEHNFPNTWEKFEWTTGGGYSNLTKDKKSKVKQFMERIWFSPSCKKIEISDLFESMECNNTE
ncbi:MAG: DNA adenine methylase [Candidatus Kariarchaeaceae archaeon]|jgi:site-specific DNA-adenine methylase